MDKPLESCGSCRFWVPLELDPGGVIAAHIENNSLKAGHCHRYPPSPLQTLSHCPGVFPGTDSDDRCGEWQAERSTRSVADSGRMAVALSHMPHAMQVLAGLRFGIGKECIRGKDGGVCVYSRREAARILGVTQYRLLSLENRARKQLDELAPGWDSSDAPGDITGTDVLLK